MNFSALLQMPAMNPAVNPASPTPKIHRHSLKSKAGTTKLGVRVIAEADSVIEVQNIASPSSAAPSSNHTVKKLPEIVKTAPTKVQTKSAKSPSMSSASPAKRPSLHERTTAVSIGSTPRQQPQSSGGISTIKKTKSIPKATTSEKTSMDKFKPKRDHRMDEIMGKVDDDGDIWVERYYLNRKDRRIYYFRSVRTKRCVLYEPPTGSGTVVCLSEVHKFPHLLQFATEPLDRPLSTIEKPNYNGMTYKERKQSLAKKKKKQSS
ncbi:expressed unknown protein [Seminavis robusta]|uniref:Uncharacterized protein n=1 Tax=Seminavis robusta TaxID=568900 RepID=A0A9N8EDR1_9STRA|nr:expressed unknown protein [Seminavis robusta]|eukprot:Sro796_g203770.1 n/a (263) ;mRNA; r:26624-27412